MNTETPTALATIAVTRAAMTTDKAAKLAKKRSARARQRGVALILVMGALAVMAVLLTEFQDETSAELASALADRDSLKAEYLAKSAVNLSRLLIAAEPTINQSIAFIPFLKTPQIPVWEFANQILGAFNDGEGQKGFLQLTGQTLDEGKHLGIEGGRFDVTIVDEDSKLNVNVGARNEGEKRRFAQQFLALTNGDRNRPLFEQRDRDGQFSDQVSICQSIVDWVDVDESMYDCNPWNPAPPSAASESDGFYTILNPPYKRKNAPLDSLDELHLVHGVGEDFWATFVDPEPDDPKKRIMTVWGQGTVNVNTANAQTLLSVICAGAHTATVCTDPMEMQKFLMAVTMLQGFTSGFPLFQSPNDFVATVGGGGMFGGLLKSLGLTPVKLDNDAKSMLSTRSKMFSIYADGIVPGYQRRTRVRIHEVVDFRDSPPPTVLQTMPLPGAAPAGSATATAGAVGPWGIPVNALVGATGGTGGGTAGAASSNGIAAAVVPNPGGTVIYHRME